MGYIRLDRRLQSWEWHDEPLTLALWVNMLLLANYEDTIWHSRVLSRGQFVTSVSNLSFISGLTPKQVRLRLERLEESGCIVTEKTNKNTIISICNYDSYQFASDDEGQTEGKQRANKGQPIGQTKGEPTFKKINKEINIQKEKESISKDIQKKTKVNDIESRQSEFRESLESYVSKYGQALIDEFFEYWSEPEQNKTNPKMRKENEKTWDLGRRLARWARNNPSYKDDIEIHDEGLDWDAIVKWLNGTGIVKIRIMDDERKRMFLAIRSKYGSEAIREAILKVQASDYLRGYTENGRPIGFDFIFTPDKFKKIYEGYYDNKSS